MNVIAMETRSSPLRPPSGFVHVREGGGGVISVTDFFFIR